MNTPFTIGINILIGLIIIIPFYTLSLIEKNKQKPFSEIHLVINVTFILWSVYAFNLAFQNPDKMNNLAMILPAWPALGIFYGFIRPHLIKKSPEKCQCNQRLALIYLLGSLTAMIMEIAL